MDLIRLIVYLVAAIFAIICLFSEETILFVAFTWIANVGAAIMAWLLLYEIDKEGYLKKKKSELTGSQKFQVGCWSLAAILWTFTFIMF